VDKDIGAEVTDETEALENDGEAAVEKIKELQERWCCAIKTWRTLKRMY